MPALNSEQKAAVATWIASGDNLSAVQKKLRDQFQLALTYMDVRFLVDDLDLTLKDPAPKADATDLAKSPAAKAPASTPASPARAQPDLGSTGEASDPSPGDDLPLEDEPLPAAGAVSVQVDGVTLLPGAIASGSVTFSDGVVGKWMVDQYGRPGFTEISQPGYRPSKEDAQAFMQELDQALRQRGF